MYNEHINHGDADMYEANGKHFKSFFAAIEEAKKADCNVVDTRTGATKWTPSPKVSAKKIRMYNEHKAAYEAQQKIA